MDFEDADQPLLAAPHYYWGCCFVCRQAGTPENPLKRCSRCHSMFYCSSAHQKAHWKDHKRMCKYLSAAADEVGAETFFGRGVEDPEDDPAKKWRVFRTNAVRTAEILMGGNLEEWEKEMFLFPRACRVCHASKREGMFDCRQCQGVTYCSELCRDEDKDVHYGSDLCNELKFAMLSDNFESTVSVAMPSIPSDLDLKFKPVIGNILQYLAPPGKKSLIPPGMHPLEELEHRFLTDRLSGPLTILHAASKAISDLRDRTELVLHIVGANIMEMLGIIKWEYIAHKLPKCSSLRIVFIGLELEQEEEGECEGLGECSDCSDIGRRVIYEMRCQTYREYCGSNVYRPPDLVACFNCGFHEYENQPEKETWKQTLPFLIRRPGIPLVFTSYTKTEAEKDLKLIFEASENCLDVMVEKSINPFRSHRPIRDLECDNNRDVFYNNQYYSLVRKC